MFVLSLFSCSLTIAIRRSNCWEMKVNRRLCGTINTPEHSAKLAYSKCANSPLPSCYSSRSPFPRMLCSTGSAAINLLRSLEDSSAMDSQLLMCWSKCTRMEQVIPEVLHQLYFQSVPVYDTKLDSVRTDSDGTFKVSGKYTKIFDMDPKVNIYHSCNYHGVRTVWNAGSHSSLTNSSSATKSLQSTFRTTPSPPVPIPKETTMTSEHWTWRISSAENPLIAFINVSLPIHFPFGLNELFTFPLQCSRIESNQTAAKCQMWK